MCVCVLCVCVCVCVCVCERERERAELQQTQQHNSSAIRTALDHRYLTSLFHEVKYLWLDQDTVRSVLTLVS